MGCIDDNLISRFFITKRIERDESVDRDIASKKITPSVLYFIYFYLRGRFLDG